MPPTGPQKPPLPKHWKKYHHNIYRDMSSGNPGNVLKALYKYIRLKKNKAADPPQEVIDAHIEVARHILKEEKRLSNIDAIIQKKMQEP